MAALRFVVSMWVGFNLLVASLVVLLPLQLEALDFGVDAIAAVVGVAGLGGVLSADPVGVAADRIGPVRLVRVGIITMAACVVGLGLFRNLGVLLVLHAIVGVCTSALRVGSQMIVRNRIGDSGRGQVHAIQGLMSRVTVLVVPVAIGLLWERWVAIWNFALPAALAVALLVAAGALTVLPPARSGRDRTGLVPLTTMLRPASGLIMFQASRAGRMLLLPLVGLELNLSAARIGLLVGLTAAADVLVSPLSGPLMDRRGRLATIIPSFSLMATGFLILGVGGGEATLVAVAAVVMGLGNGLSSGLLLTLGSDLAPPDNEGRFLGRFGALTDTGRLVGPILIGLLGRLVGLNAAAIALAALTGLGLALVIIFVGETRPADKRDDGAVGAHQGA